MSEHMKDNDIKEENIEKLSTTEAEIVVKETKDEASIDVLVDPLDKAQQTIASLEDDMLRLRADIENMRRRHSEDMDKMRKFAIEGFAESLLPTMDSLQLALADEKSDVEILKKGVELTLKQLQSSFDKYKIVAINPIGEVLNPSYHQAVSTIDSIEPANTIINVFQKGYTIADRLLRPALVVTAANTQA
jgi:molecular chaperone GrpE